MGGWFGLGLFLWPGLGFGLLLSFWGLCLDRTFGLALTLTLVMTFVFGLDLGMGSL